MKAAHTIPEGQKLPQPLVAQVETSPEKRADVSRKQKVREKPITDAQLKAGAPTRYPVNRIALRIELPGLKTGNGIADIKGNYPSKGVGERAAWFKDSEGNLLGIGQPVRV